MELTPTRVEHGPAEYPITPSSFPTLYWDIQRLAETAGAKSMQFVVLENFGGTGIDFERNTIGIGSRMLNDLTYDELVSAVGHELGHDYRRRHPGMPFTGSPLPNLTMARLEEIEADRLSACFLGTKTPVIDALKDGGKNMDKGLPIALRVEAVEEFSLGSCPSDIRPVRGKFR